jgi:hypothetical protein
VTASSRLAVLIVLFVGTDVTAAPHKKKPKPAPAPAPETVPAPEPAPTPVPAPAATPAAAPPDNTIELKAQIETLQAQLAKITTQLESIQKDNDKRNADAPNLVRLKPKSGATFLVPGGGDVRLYGNLDVSFDVSTKGLNSNYAMGGMPLGDVGWLPAIASNLSNLGARGRHPLLEPVSLVWQLEAGIDISATPGTKNTNSNTSDAVNGALFSRNSFVGISVAA